MVIAKGKLVAQGATRDIQQMRRSRVLEVTVHGKVDEALRVLRAIDGVARVAREGVPDADVATLRCSWSKKLAPDRAMLAAEAVVAALVGAGVGVREVRGAGGSLEEVFAELTRADVDVEPAPGASAPGDQAGDAAS